MGALTNYYVDPTGGNDSTGDGSSGNPWQTVQKALNTITRDSTNGDQINVKAGGTDTLSSALSFATYGTPAASAPLIIRGYTSSANDGGQGVISGGGTTAIINSGSLSHIKLVDMRFTNVGGNTIVSLNTTSTIALHCEFDTMTSAISNGVQVGRVINCYFHNIAGIGVASPSLAYGNTFRNETNDFTHAIQVSGNAVVIFNLIDIDGSSNGININSSNIFVAFNSVFSSGGTGVGIRNNGSGDLNAFVINNTVQGFSGGGGIGILIAGQNADTCGYNLLFNNTTATSLTGDLNVALGNNDTAGASPFINAGSDDFDPVSGLFASYPSYPTTWNNYAATQQNLLRMAAQYPQLAARARYLMGVG